MTSGSVEYCLIPAYITVEYRQSRSTASIVIHAPFVNAIQYCHTGCRYWPLLPARVQQENKRINPRIILLGRLFGDIRVCPTG